jgi:hypothetical protein
MFALVVDYERITGKFGGSPSSAWAGAFVGHRLYRWKASTIPT